MKQTHCVVFGGHVFVTHGAFAERRTISRVAAKRAGKLLGDSSTETWNGGVLYGGDDDVCPEDAQSVLRSEQRKLRQPSPSQPAWSPRANETRCAGLNR